jgi:hypothetical protein
MSHLHPSPFTAVCSLSLFDRLQGSRSLVDGSTSPAFALACLEDVTGLFHPNLHLIPYRVSGRYRSICPKAHPNHRCCDCDRNPCRLSKPTFVFPERLHLPCGVGRTPFGAPGTLEILSPSFRCPWLVLLSSSSVLYTLRITRTYR